ncbi:PepSY domain-containing protein [Neiella marina]|uniref:PepSY domain-containing protein n=1 Tax=Neiella holothuriorum TaxID=2870530 RepID=A0ABS7EL15_9GAMM|nr:PepSY-associated TM helix domain-containing protein [Neiella holothuriorum]MBW8192905.1 PepSY domain-containing protein [Neiella holothuriorum]
MRKALFKWHSYGALIALLPIFIVSITGSILVFKVELDTLLRPQHMAVEAQALTPRANLDGMMAQVLSANPDYELAGWELFDDKQRSDAAYLLERGTENWYKVYVDQYQGKVLSEPQPMDHYFTDWLLELHYTFLLHTQGAVVGFIIALVMLFLGISGIILYRRFWAKLFTLRFGAAKRVLFSDLHKFSGITSSPILIIIAFTGAYWNFIVLLHEAEHALEGHTYIQAPYHSPEISFEALLQQTEQELDSFRAGYLSIPHEPDEQITFWGEVDSTNPLNSEYASTVTFNRTSGALISTFDIRTADNTAVVLDSFRKLHFGYFAGLPSRILWCILGLAPVLLGITGVLLYLIRKRKISAT